MLEQTLQFACVADINDDGDTLTKNEAEEILKKLIQFVEKK